MTWNHSDYQDQTDHHNDHGYLHDDQTIALTVLCLLSAVGVMTVMSNGILLLAMFVDPLKRFRTPPMYLVINRATADFLVGILVDPFYVMHYISKDHGNNNTIVLICTFVSKITVNTAMWATVTLVCERYLCIKKPFRYDAIANKQNIIFASGCIWTYSILTALTAFTNSYHEIYALLETQVNMAIPSIIITALFCSVYRFLIKQRYNDVLRFLPSQGLRRNELLTKSKQDKRMLNTVILILILLYCCLAPHVIIVHTDFFTHAPESFIYKLLYELSWLFVFLNSGINPFVYAWRHKVFRRSVKLVLCRPSRNNVGIRSSRNLATITDL